jgi:hypothetical protein
VVDDAGVPAFAPLPLVAAEVEVESLLAAEQPA